MDIFILVKCMLIKKIDDRLVVTGANPVCAVRRFYKATY